MSNTSDQSTWQFAMIGQQGLAGGTFGAGDGWTDEFALALYNALNVLTWPANTSFSLVKYEVSTTTSQITGNPGQLT